MNKIREIIRLHETAQMSVRMISRALHISRPAVDTYLKQVKNAGLEWAEAEHLGDDQLLTRLTLTDERAHDPRLMELLTRLPSLLAQLGKKHVTRQLLWEEYRRECRDGYEYSQFCFYIQSYAADSEISMHLHHEPGKRLFVDFAGDKPSLVDLKTGVERKVELFVAVLPASGLIYAESIASQKIEDLILGIRHALEYAGGVPSIIVPDNLTAAVTKPNAYEPDINQTFEDFGRYYGCVVIPARVRRPKDKALVEAAVHLVYTRVMAQLRHKVFSTICDLNTAIWELIDALNDRLMRKIGSSRRQRFEQIEAERLSPLPVRPYALRRFLPSVTVQVNYHVYLNVDKHYYSVPYEYRRKKVRIAYTNADIEIYHNNIRIAVHRREPGANQYTTNRDHMPSQHRIMTEWSPERFLRWAEEVGAETRDVIAEVLDNREVPEQAFKSCLGILSLAKKYGKTRLEASCRRAKRYRIFSYKGIKNILDRGLDHQPSDVPVQPALPIHENLRGGAYYARQAEGSAS
jgi:transposase